MANKQQSDQILELFNKVYGFDKGLSRRGEQQKRYNRIQEEKKKDKKEKNNDDEKGLLTDLFDVNKYMIN